MRRAKSNSAFKYICIKYDVKNVNYTQILVDVYARGEKI